MYLIIKKIDYSHIQYGMYLYYTVTTVCYFVTSSIFKDLVTYHGSTEREIKFKFEFKWLIKVTVLSCVDTMNLRVYCIVIFIINRK